MKLAFTGQDSLHIDWMGALRMYVLEHWIELRQGVAYQVDGNDTTLPVGWQPSYAHQAGTSYVGFTFGSFNPTLPLVLQIGYGPLAMGGGPDQRNLGWSTFKGRHRRRRTNLRGNGYGGQPV
ncbi:MAG: hypothetical protein KBH07_10720 [Flavobacteriales bacterium]|nr:hypothetical protein [Flavobacteriales bacterium]